MSRVAEDVFPKASYRIVIPPATSHVVDLRWGASTSNHVAGCNAYRGPDGAGWEKINDTFGRVDVLQRFHDQQWGRLLLTLTTAVGVSGESKRTLQLRSRFPCRCPLSAVHKRDSCGDLCGRRGDKRKYSDAAQQPALVRETHLRISHSSIANINEDKPVLNDAVSSEISASKAPCTNL